MSRIPTMILLSLVFTLVTSFGVSGEADTSMWSSPSKFFEVRKGGYVQSPVLVTDSGGNLHAFFGAAMTDGEESILYYSRWDGSGWSDPADVLVSPDNRSVWPATLYMDGADYVHAFWAASGGAVWHSSAHASRLADARTWSEPNLVSTADAIYDRPDVVQVSEDTWYLVYTNRQLNEVRVLRSDDGAQTWLWERGVHYEDSPDTWIAYPGIVVAPDGALWVWWQELDPDGRGMGNKGTLYTVSTDGGLSWAVPDTLVEGYYSGSLLALGTVMIRVVVGGIGVGGRTIAFSYDSGLIWTDPVDISAGHGDGMQGVGVVIDSAGVWHFAEQTGSTFATVAWEEGLWAPLEFIVPLEELEACCTTPGRTTENVVAGISDGNRMHAFFEEDDRILWHTSRTLDAPSVAPRPPQAARTAAARQPERTQAPPATWTAGAADPTPPPAAASASDLGQPEELDRAPGWFAVLAGVVPAFLLLLAIFALRVARVRRG